MLCGWRMPSFCCVNLSVCVFFSACERMTWMASGGFLLVPFSQDAADGPAKLSISGVGFIFLALSEFEAGPSVLVGVSEEYFNAPFRFVEGKVFEVGKFREVVVGRIYVGRPRQDGADDSIDDFRVEGAIDVFYFYCDVSLPCCGS